MTERMTSDPGGLMLTLPARSENVAVVRHAVAGLAGELGIDGTGIDDLKTAVTEACMNVVVHAYDGEPGPLQVEVGPDDGGLTVVVRDFGGGIRPRADVDERPSLRLGLSLIAALSSSFQIAGGLDRGTEITMRFVAGDEQEGPRAAGTKPPPEPAEQAEVIVAEPRFLSSVLARMIGAFAARREITVDRLSDAVLITDAIAARAPRSFAGAPARMTIADGDGGLDLRVGPMAGGEGNLLRESLRLPEQLGSLESLADGLRVEGSEEGDYLVVEIAVLAAS